MFVPQIVVKEGGRFPDWAHPFDLESVRLTRTLRTVDPSLLVTLVTQAPPRFGLPPHCYVTWNRSAQYGGYVPGRVLRDDHDQPLRGRLPVEQILADFRALYADAERGITPAQRVEEHNDRLIAEEERRQRERNTAMFEYAHGAIIAELDGASRFTPEDVEAGWTAASEGTQPLPKGQVVSLPSDTKEPD